MLGKQSRAVKFFKWKFLATPAANYVARHLRHNLYSRSQLIPEHPIRFQFQFKDFPAKNVDSNATPLKRLCIQNRQHEEQTGITQVPTHAKRNKTKKLGGYFQVLVSNSDFSSNKQSTKIGIFPWRLFIKIPIKIQLVSYVLPLSPPGIILCRVLVDTERS